MISLGLIGCGEVAESGHVPTILSDDRFRLAAACDVDLARARTLAARAGGIAAYADWRKMLDAQSLDGVVLALPPEVSPDIAIESLRRGIAVLDEKPLATTLPDGMRLRQAVEDYGGVYQIGFVLRYGAWVEKIRQLAPKLGTPMQINIEVYDERLDGADPNHFSRIQGFIQNSSAMTHEGSHVIDYVGLWHPSPWALASAVTQQTNPTFTGPNVWNAQIDFEDRSTLKVKIAWLLPDLPESTVTLIGPEGRLDFNCVTGRGIAETAGGEETFALPPLAPDWEQQYQAFADAIKRRCATQATVYDGLRALEMTSACELSARSATTVAPRDLAQWLGLNNELPDHSLIRPQTRIQAG